MGVLRVFSAVFILIAAVSCEKPAKNEQLDSSSLVGVWELRAIRGGMIPSEPGSIRPGNGDQWRFTQEEYARFYKDTLYQEGRYLIGKGTGTDYNTQRRVDQFVFDLTPAESFELANDTLRIFYGMIAADGIIMNYVKISDNPGL